MMRQDIVHWFAIKREKIEGFDVYPKLGRGQGKCRLRQSNYSHPDPAFLESRGASQIRLVAKGKKLMMRGREKRIVLD